MKAADRLGQASRWICVQPEFRQLVEDVGLGSLEALASRGLGEPITDRRSSWVRLVSIDSKSFFIKTYDYPASRDRWRGALRNTFLRQSRAQCEWRALSWLREHGFAAPEPLGVMEKRRGGWLYRAVLVTGAWPGHPLDRLLPVLAPPEQCALWEAVTGYVARLHAAGFRDRNMDLRNLLAARDASGGWRVAKIDSPRYRITAPGAGLDRAARADLQKLADQRPSAARNFSICSRR